MRISLLALLCAGCSSPDGSGKGGPADSAAPQDSGPGLDTASGGDSAGADPWAPAEACRWEAAEDVDPDPAVVGVELEAAAWPWDPGTGLPIEEGLLYNGLLAGPIIEVEVGQRLDVRYINNLDHENTVHWHGLRVPEEMDGALRMMDMVPAGGEFSYSLPIVDSGYYWYHPHMDTDRDLERGLYGRIISRHPDEPRRSCDLPVVLDDVLLDAEGQIAPEEDAHMQLMGRLGNLLLANGRSDRRVEVPPGQSTLLRLVNAANARYWDLYIPGHSLQVVASDGGWLAEPWEVDHLVVAPGERWIVAVDWQGEPGDQLELINRRHMLHDEDAEMSEYDPMGEGENPVMAFVIGEGAPEVAPLSLPADDSPALVDPGSTAHRWLLDEQMEEGIVTIDGLSYPDVPLVEVEADQLTALEVQNDSEMHHPFHIHGNRFQILSIDGEPPPWTGWKDTFDIPPYATVRIASEMDNPGEWMYHCHILEHAELGMAGFMRVGESPMEME